jgi:3-deoxy-D-manno-octulosonic-acid transferase
MEAGPTAPGVSAADFFYGAAAGMVFPAAWWGSRLAGGAAVEARRGFLPASAGPTVWVHGASAGEMNAGRRLIELMRRVRGDFTVLYTATNATGCEYAARHLAADDRCSLAPWDAPAWIERAFDRVRPALLLLVETELWPRLVFEAHRRGVVVLCVSARIYDRDLNRYRVARPWIAPLLRRMACVAAQDETQRDRFVRLGARSETVHALGNLKYLEERAVAPLDLDGDAGDSSASAARPPLVAVGSPRADEIELVFAALDQLPAGAARFVVAPRRRGDVDRVVAAARRRGWSWTLRSAVPRRADWRVLVLDTMGELDAAYAAAVVAVVGGGFSRHGGHNLFEALRAGAPVLFGPHATHFDAECAALRRVCPEACVTSAAELGARLRAWLAEPQRRARTFAAQRNALPDTAALGAACERLLGPWFDRALSSRP